MRARRFAARAAVSCLASWGAAAFAADTHAAKAPHKQPVPDPVPKVMPLDSGLAKAFRDVALEERCDALRQFAQKFADKYFAAGTYQNGACGEGNGLGGARYTLDFKMVPPGRAPLAYRIDVATPDKAEPKVRLCDADPQPMACSTNPPLKPLAFDAPPGRFATTERAHIASLAFYATQPNALHLLPTLSAWVTAHASKHQIYGMTYDAFVRAVIADGGGLPLTAGSPAAHVQLKPDADKKPGAGKVVFAEPVDAGLMACFKCSTVSCLNDQVRYRFDDRFLALTRPAETAGALDLGAGWVINAATPTDAVHPWSFACGVSRYSVQNAQTKK